MLYREKPRQTAAHEADDRTDGEVDASGDNDEAHPDAEDPEARCDG